ncbi:RNA polymerase factor sigma-54 [Aliifodinibius sp. S!AR15-10]|uniref:RNA polymerase factor sigma-54 n=1 Tax=Aliifodinibius sp. S!AR15-10 TaxID=2950437 RepID=UPI00286493C8|nr:RNA polymerase factor sigma-54 [Aliifodinibius sp. S!AR15-10]MDR8389735.1 RNA polymerase factor sigma-54 [Aliifodinibius sp. S!AR15-10]
MIKTGQSQQLSQKQSQQQRLSPQQIQYIKLLQLPMVALEQRIKEEMELNPVLEEAEPDELQKEEQLDSPEDWEEKKKDNDEVDPVDQNEEVDWEEFMHNTEYEGENYGGYSGSGGNQEWRDLPNPYHESLLEELEHQVGLLDLTDNEKLVADQILGSLDHDGYFRRELEAVVDNIAFNEGVLTSAEEVEKVRKQIQRLDPPGIASTDLRDCLVVQLEMADPDTSGRNIALKMLKNHWEAFEKKHFSKLKKKLNIGDEELKSAFDCIKGLDPKPGGGGTEVEDTQNYIEPDFEVRYQPATDEEGKETGEGDFIIKLNDRNVPALRISPRYKKMWDDLKKKKKKNSNDSVRETKNFIKDKIDSAQWFIDSIRQRQNTLMNTMKTIVALQEDFFKHGEGLKPMILKDIADRVNLDISTISRVVNGKYVQTNFGVFELKYFFSEGLETESGEEVSNREVKNSLQQIVDNENKKKPLSDQAIAKKLEKEGYKVARRTVSKYREQLNIPVARLRKQIM